MPKCFEVKTSTGAYVVEVGRGLVNTLLSRHGDAVVIVDERLRYRVPVACSKVISLSATEAQKSLDRMPEVILQLRQFRADRSTHVIAIGGGVIQDIATFVCSVYMRGISWSYMPTTMLGMADSCIGGKSSINVAGLKNLVSNIYPPREVVVDTDFVSTLDAAQTVGGLVEAAKICFARGETEFAAFQAIHPTFPMTSDQAEAVVICSLMVKRWFIEVDEFDKRERLLLNYGHTFGHAVEAATDFGIAHGLAVGMGILAANHVALNQAWLSDQGKELVRSMNVQMVDMISLAQCDVSTPIPLSKVLEKFESDKKHQPDHYRVVAPQVDGALKLVALPKTHGSLKVIAEGIDHACRALGWPLSVSEGA